MARTHGVELMRRLSDGDLQQAPSDFLEQTRDDVSSAIEELLDVGARIRPLFVGGTRVGWVRAAHTAERRALKRWLFDEVELIEQLLQLGTTLTIDEIRALSIEVRSITRVVREMTESDMRLYPFIAAFVTTTVSEQLWFSKGTHVTAFRDRIIPMPDGKQMRIHTASDQARLWAALCHYRIQAKKRLEASMNTVLIIRPWVGKGADPIASDLKAIARSLQTDSLDPWRESVKAKGQTNLHDGWAHSEDDTREGIHRELMGMINNDRHEQVIALFEEQERARAARQQREIDERIARRGGRGFIEQDVTPMTEQQVQDRALKVGRPRLGPIVEEETQSSPADRLAKYR